MADAETEDIDRVRAVGLASRILKDASMSEDLVQEAYLRVMRRAPVEAQQSKPYFFKTLTRLCFDELKRRRDRAVLPLVEPWVQTGPERTVEDGERHAQIRAAMSSLPDRMRVVLILRFWEKLSFAEIAEHVGVSESNAATLTYRAFRALRKSLGEEAGE